MLRLQSNALDTTGVQNSGQPPAELTFQKASALCQVSKVAKRNVKELNAGQKQGSKLSGTLLVSWLFPAGQPLPVTTATAQVTLPKDANLGQPIVATVGRLATSRRRVTLRARHRTRSTEAEGRTKI